LQQCGYSVLRTDFHFGAQQPAPLAAFAYDPPDVRSACIVVAHANGDAPEEVVCSYRETGAPIVFLCRSNTLQWWQQAREKPLMEEEVSARELNPFFAAHQQDFTPEQVYNAKTRAVFDSQQQLGFVDIGLLPLVEQEIGKKLTGLISRSVKAVARRLALHRLQEDAVQDQWLQVFRSVFWLIAAKILRDKNVNRFRDLDLCEVAETFTRLSKHYGQDGEHLGPRQIAALSPAAREVSQFARLDHVTTESLAYVYESALVPKRLRKWLGIHSTPTYLVDYIVWNLLPWIEQIPVANCHVLEPACGHGAFLVSAMRALRELLPKRYSQPGTRHRYFQKRLHGVEQDAFAVEIARLSLTLADIPNPDGWDLQCQDMFQSCVLEREARRAMILLANPPFEDFKGAEKEAYPQRQYVNKATEMLARTLPQLRPGAVFGLVVPRGFLHEQNASPVRKMLLNRFELREICLFPDKVFRFSDSESAILLGRRAKARKGALRRLKYGRVRDQPRDVRSFQQRYAVSSQEEVPQNRFCTPPQYNLQLPELSRLWGWCEGYGKLDDIARIGQGLSYERADQLPPGTQLVSEYAFPGSVPGFAQWSTGLHIHEEPPQVQMSVDPDHIQRPRSGTETGTPQAVLNYSPVSRGPWRVVAFIDRVGRALTSSFMAIRPRSRRYPLEFFWALCNSPFANAYVYTNTGKRVVGKGIIAQLPLPSLSFLAISRVVSAARAYLDAMASPEPLAPKPQRETAHALLMRMDAEVLRLYDLPPRLERELLDLFAGHERPGVPPGFDRYFPEDFEPCFSLHEYLSQEFQQSRVEVWRKHYQPVRDPHLLSALRRAVEDFGE